MVGWKEGRTLMDSWMGSTDEGSVECDAGAKWSGVKCRGRRVRTGEDRRTSEKLLLVRLADKIAETQGCSAPKLSLVLNTDFQRSKIADPPLKPETEPTIKHSGARSRAGEALPSLAVTRFTVQTNQIPLLFNYFYLEKSEPIAVQKVPKIYQKLFNM